MESYLLTHFHSKSCTNLSETVLAHKKNEQRNVNFKTMPFRRPNDRIWLKNDDSPTESFLLTYFQSKSSTNLPQTEFQRKKKTTNETKIFKIKCHFGVRNDGIWLKNNEPLTESYLLTHFQSISCTNLSETEFWHKQKTSTETKIFKKCHFGDRNDRILLKNDDSPGESLPLTYFQSKVALICLKLNSGTQKKYEHRNKNFQKNATSEAETMEFGRKTMNLFRSLICSPISNLKVEPI